MKLELKLEKGKKATNPVMTFADILESLAGVEIKTPTDEVSVTMSREQAERLCRWLEYELYGVTLRKGWL